MAVLVIVVAACTSSDIEIPQLDGKMHFTAKIAAPNSGSDTKTVYTVDGSSINVAWRAKEDGVYEGDKIALIHNGVKDIATVTAVDGSGNATIEATISGTPQDGDDVVLVYPAAAVKDATGGTSFTPDETYAQKGFTQDGTLDYIQNNLDGRQGSGQLSVSGGTASLKGSVKMNSQIAIWKLNLTHGTTEIKAKTVSLKLGNQAIAGGADDSGKSEYYFCVVPATLDAIYAAAITASLPTPAFTIEANDGTDTYTYTKESQLNLANNGYYQSTVTFYDATVNIAAGAVMVPAGEHWLVVGGSAATSNTITIEDGATVTLQNVNIIADNTNAINCLGNAEIVLNGSNTIQSKTPSSGTLSYAVIKAGTYAPTKTTLTISGDGILNASPSYPATTKVHDGAVIGANSDGDCGNIVINSGTITVSNSSYGAAIGSGRVANNTSRCGLITINGGTVNATSSGGAGIGTGGRTSTGTGTTTCDGITINGGTVTASSGAGAAIGAGQSENKSGDNSKVYCGNILITGGTIDARTSHRDNAGAAIGGGFASMAGTITIRGGNVNVTAVGGSYAAGIGAGSSKSQCGAISIEGGSVDAQGGTSSKEGAGIGTGKGTAGNQMSVCGTITITNGVTVVKAYNSYGSDYKMNIGKGASSNASCGTVTINGVTGAIPGGSHYEYKPGN